jgi:eukaryotic-like serine/threonine-protein kinase
MVLSAADWLKLNRLLDEALDLEPSLRAQWVEALPAEHGALSQTLRELLVRDGAPETSEVLLESPLLSEPPFAAMASGDIVGPYRVIREIGAGGTATVWLAERTDGSLRRQVALKLPRVAWMDRGLAQRLNRERDILASLEHPSIARLYDAGVDEAGRPFLALEFVEGMPLDQYVFERGLPVARRLALFISVARAVAFAHAHLVVHRDLKPSNILVRSNGEISLLDFGIARLLQPESLHDLQLTRVGGRALTPQYAAPEQFKSQPITVATDVYSLGVLLYWLLTARSPYDLKRESLADLEDAILNQDPVSMLRGVDAKLARTLRGDLEMIVGKAMRKQPADRYETVSAFIEDIERYQKQMPVRARPPRFSYRVTKFIARNTVSVVAGSVTASALVLGLSIALWQAHVARVEAQRAERIKSFVESIFTQAVPKQGAGGVVTASDLLVAANKRVEAQLGGNKRDKGELQAMIGASFLALDEPANATPVLEQALANCDAQRDLVRECELHSAVQLATSLSGTRQHEAALSLLDRYLPTTLPATRSGLVDVVIGHRLRGELLTHLNRDQEALIAFNKSRAIAERSLGLDHVETLGALTALAAFLNYNLGPQGAVDVAEEAMRRATASRGAMRPDIVLTQVELTYANSLTGLGRSAEAEPLLRRALADQRQLDPTDTPRVADAAWLLATALSSQGKLDESIPLMRRALDIEMANAAVPSSALRERLMSLGAMYAAARLPDDALTILARVDELDARLGPPTTPVLLRNSLTRAHALVHLGNWSQAQSTIAAVIEASNEPALATARIEALMVAAFAARMREEFAQAGKLARQIIQETDAAKLSHPKRAAFFSEAAASLLAAGQVVAARSALDQARSEYASAGFVASVRMSDYLITDARLSVAAGDPRLERDLEALVLAWERVNPNSVWGAESRYWLARCQALSGKHNAATDSYSRAVQVLRDSSLPAMRRLARSGH